LVDGIVTDDSDIFLFGGTRVYKNMFNQAKFVECYLTSDLESEFGLSRQHLISIAQLLGSDYTDGLPGVGPVTALEMLSEFDSLLSFKEWWVAVQNGTRSKQDDASSAFRKKFRKNATKLFLPPNFPDPRVDQAYFEPEVDSDPSAFMWGVPDLSALRAFLMSTIGWSPERTDEVLVPVIKDMNRRETEGTQANITSFFSGNVGAGAFAPRRRGEGTSKRLESALHRIGDKARRDTDGIEHDASAQDEPEQDPTTVPKRSARRGTKSTKRSRKNTSAEREEEDDDEEDAELRRERPSNIRNKRKKVREAANGNAA
jgi:DNA excision repair protein ERCC-5